MIQYDPAQVVLTFGSIVTGYAEGTFIEASRNEDTWKLVVGADGATVRVRNRNASGRIKVTLMQTSPLNAVFDALCALDEATGAGVLPLLMKDLNGTELCAAAEAWLVKPSDKQFGKDVGDREWTIEMGECSFA